MKYLFLALFFSLLVHSLQAQEELTLEGAFEKAMEENYGIQVSIVNFEMSQLDNHPGNAGLLPRVFLQSGVDYSSNNSKQTFFDGSDRTANWAGNFSFNSAVQGEWTVYDGGAGQSRKRILEGYEQLSESEIEVRSRDLLTRIANAFYAVLYYQDTEKLLEQSVVFYEDLKNLEQERMQLGRGTRISLLQTQTELNRERARLEQVMSWKETALNDLFRLMNVESEEVVLVSDGYFEEAVLERDQLLEEVLSNNPEVLYKALQQQIIEEEITLRKSEQYPTVDLIGGVSYNLARSEVGILQTNRNLSPYVGATLRFNIFDGERSRRAIQRSKLQTEIGLLELNDLRAGLSYEMKNRFEEFETAGRLLEMELENLAISQENLGLAEEMYLAGRISNFELREVQQQAVRAEEAVADLRRVRATSFIGIIALTNRYFWD